MTASKSWRYLSVDRPSTEDLRFVTGAGTYVADVERPRTLHVAVVGSSVAAGRIRSVDTTEAEKAPGVVEVLTGRELARSTDPLRQYIELPGVDWRPLAAEQVCYAGEWVAAVAAESRALAEDAAELVRIDVEERPAVTDPEAALQEQAPVVHVDSGSNLAYQRTFTWGPVAEDIAASAHREHVRVRWGRSSTVPLETFGVLAEWDPGRNILDVWASIQMPQYAEQLARALRIPLSSVRVHYDVDVGGSYGVKRGIKQSVLVGYLSRKTGRPVRLLEDRIDNMRSGDAHGPDRIFDVGVAFDDDGKVRSLQLRTLDDEGAYPGRSPLQLGKPIGAIVGPYTINSVEYEAVAVMTNKTSQVAVRGFGQTPTNYAIETAMDLVARTLEMDPVEVRRRNLIPPDAFPYEIPSGTSYDSGNYQAVLDRALELADIEALRSRKAELAADGLLGGIGIATCLEPSGGNALFEPLLNPTSKKTTFPESCRLRIDGHGLVTATIAFSSAGQGHETMVATLVGEELGVPPEQVRVVRATSQDGLPTQSPVASRITIVIGDAIASAAGKLRTKMLAIAGHDLGCDPSLLNVSGDGVRDQAGELCMTWDEVVEIAHRQYHRLPPDTEPGLDATSVAQVPTGGVLPTPEGLVQMYPCYAFSTHVVFVVIDPATGDVDVERYSTVHDCGTVINPEIVRGMVLGGIAHGIGAALYEEFRYSPEGQPLSTTFIEYLLPSMAEVPPIEMDEMCTPSPLTSHGQKGIGEGGYMAAPAAITSAVNDALHSAGVQLYEVPMSPSKVWALLSDVRDRAVVA